MIAHRRDNRGIIVGININAVSKGIVITSNDFERAVIIKVSHFNKLDWRTLRERRVCPYGRKRVVRVETINYDYTVVDRVRANHDLQTAITFDVAQFQITHAINSKTVQDRLILRAAPSTQIKHQNAPAINEFGALRTND